MGSLISFKGNDHALIVQGSKDIKKKIVKEKKPKSNNEDESSKPIDEGSMKKVKKKGSTSKCSYFRKGFDPENKCFKNNMDIMSQLLEKHNIEVPDEIEKSTKSSEHCHSCRNSRSNSMSKYAKKKHHK